MAFPGGTAAKLGNSYEWLWTVRCVIRLLNGDYEAIHLEPLAEDEHGFEFFLRADTYQEYHQAKRQHSKGHWTLSRLNEEGILKSFWTKAESTKNKCLFISSSDAQDLRELCQIARRLNIWLQFELEAMQFESHKATFDKLLNYLELTASDGEALFDVLKRIEVRTSDENEIKENNFIGIQRLFNCDIIHAQLVYDHIVQFLSENLNKEMRKDDFLEDLAKYNLVAFQSEEIKLNYTEVNSYLEYLISKLERVKGVLEFVELETVINFEWQPNFRVISDTPQTNFTISSRLQDELINLDEITERFSKFVIVGMPGAGKTTSLKSIAVRSAKACLRNNKSIKTYPIPLYIDLPQWQNDTSKFESFIESQFSKWDFGINVISILNRGLAVLYLDGLNEMGASGGTKAQQIHKWLNGLDELGNESIAVLEPQRVIITCRKDDYFSQYNLGIPVIEALELSKDRIQDFAHKYLGNEKAFDFLEYIFHDKNRLSLLPLARNPYRLFILIRLYQTSLSGDLPNNTGLLFKRMVQDLWENEQKKNPSLIAYDRVLDALSTLAFSMIDAGMPTTVSRNYALLYIRDEEIFDVCKDVFLLLNGNTISFYHQSMQEYFAAVALERVGIEHITLTQSNPNYLNPAINDYTELTLSGKWEQVVIALTGIIQNPATIVRAIAEIDPFLAQLCINSGIEMERIDLQSNYIKALNGSINVLPSAIYALGIYGDEAAAQYLIPFLKHTNSSIQDTARRALIELGDKASETLLDELTRRGNTEKNQITSILTAFTYKLIPRLINRLSSTDEDTKQHIFAIFGYLGRKETVDFLLEAYYSASSSNKLQILVTLGRIGGTKALIHLKGVLHDESINIRLHVIKAFSHIKSDEGDFVVNTLDEYINNEDNEDILVEIANVLGKFKKNQTSIKILHKLVADTRWIVHLAAYKALKKIGTPKALRPIQVFNAFRTRYENRLRDSAERLYKEYGAIGFLFALKHSYESHLIHWRVANQIARLPIYDMSVFTEALQDSSENVRNKIIYAIGTRGDPKLAHFLIPSLYDSSPFVCGEAIKAIGKLGYMPAIPRIAELLDNSTLVYSNSRKTIGEFALETLKKINTSESLVAIQNWEKSKK